jgi:hypothetical protein
MVELPVESFTGQCIERHHGTIDLGDVHDVL